MAYEFKRLSDVEVVAEPTETANVLIEEDGVIKKAPKTAVGGTKSEWDAVIHLEGGSSMSSVETFTLVEGTHENIYNKIVAKEMPKIFIYWNYQYGDCTYTCIEASSVSIDEGFTYIRIVFHDAWGNCYYNLYLRSDNIVSDSKDDK